MAVRTGGSDELGPEINVTPFVDVMRVLLIIFMLVIDAEVHSDGARHQTYMGRGVIVLHSDGHGAVVSASCTWRSQCGRGRRQG